MVTEELRGNARLPVVGIGCRERISGFEPSSLGIILLGGGSTRSRAYKSCISTRQSHEKKYCDERDDRSFPCS